MKTETFIYEETIYVIVIGKNKYENWELLENANETDIWFHVKSEPSCYVILQTEKSIKEIPKQVIKRCACYCKSHSKSKTVKECEIMYSSVKEVCKGKKVGEAVVKKYKSVCL